MRNNCGEKPVWFKDYWREGWQASHFSKATLLPNLLIWIEQGAIMGNLLPPSSYCCSVDQWEQNVGWTSIMQHCVMYLEVVMWDILGISQISSVKTYRVLCNIVFQIHNQCCIMLVSQMSTPLKCLRVVKNGLGSLAELKIVFHTEIRNLLLQRAFILPLPQFKEFYLLVRYHPNMEDQTRSHQPRFCGTGSCHGSHNHLHPSPHRRVGSLTS